MKRTETMYGYVDLDDGGFSNFGRRPIDEKKLRALLGDNIRVCTALVTYDDGLPAKPTPKPGRKVSKSQAAKGAK